MGEEGRDKGAEEAGEEEQEGGVLKKDFCPLSSPAPLARYRKAPSPEILTVTVARQFIEANQAPWQTQPPL